MLRVTYHAPLGAILGMTLCPNSFVRHWARGQARPYLFARSGIPVTTIHNQQLTEKCPLMRFISPWGPLGALGCRSQRKQASRFVPTSPSYRCLILASPRGFEPLWPAYLMMSTYDVISWMIQLHHRHHTSVLWIKIGLCRALQL